MIAIKIKCLEIKKFGDRIGDYLYLVVIRASLKKAKRGKYENQEQLITQKTGHNHEYCLILDVLSS